MNVLTVYGASRVRTTGVLLPNTADRRALAHTHPSLAILHCCDPHGINVAARLYAGGVYLVESTSSDGQLGSAGFNALRRTIHLYRYTIRAEDHVVDERGAVSFTYDFPRGEYVGALDGLSYVAADAAVLKLVTFEDRLSGAFDFLFTPTVSTALSLSPMSFPLFFSSF